jgi:hypothetical protein
MPCCIMPCCIMPCCIMPCCMPCCIPEYVPCMPCCCGMLACVGNIPCCGINTVPLICDCTGAAMTDIPTVFGSTATFDCPAASKLGETGPMPPCLCSPAKGCPLNDPPPCTL